MASPSTPRDHTKISRRAVAKGAAWSVPTVIATTIAPAFASSSGNNYRFTWSIYSEAHYGDYPYIRLTNTVQQYSNGYALPQGFSVTNMVYEAGDQWSETTTATITSLYLVYEIPQWMINPNYLANPFYADGTWGDWTYAGYDPTRTYSDGGASVRYYFRWDGVASYPTQVRGTSYTQAWPNSQLDLYLVPSAQMHEYDVMLPTNFFGGYEIRSGVDIANGGDVTNVTYDETTDWITFD